MLSFRFIADCFRSTLSLDPERRRCAESCLSVAADYPNFALVVLYLIAEPSYDEEARQAAALNLKNYLRLRWSSEDSPIVDIVKERIKSVIVPVMLSATPKIQSQLREALAIIGNHDFPKSWSSVLPQIVSKLKEASQALDYGSVNGILSIANLIFKKFRFQYQTNDLLLDLKYCLDNFAPPFLEIFVKTASLIDADATAAPATNLQSLFESQRLCCRIFYSLNFQELPVFFKDHVREWMTEFRKYLTTSYPALEESPDGVTLVNELRAAVCENINLYVEKYEEEFQGFLNDFALAVSTLLGNESRARSTSHDRLAITAIKFLTTVSTSVHHAFFAGDGVIPQIFQDIVIPNVRLGEDDEELFEMNFVDYIRRDVEGSDLDTRRRIACELLKGIASHYVDVVRSIVSTQIQSLLSSFAANPGANWKDKDCAIYLVVSLATKKAGTSYVSTDLVDVQNFFESVIVPELQTSDVNGNPMLKAGALKFFTMFWTQISKQVALKFLPNLVSFIAAESNVVHSYAARCIAKLLLVKDEGGRARYSSADIKPVCPMLIWNLFSAFMLPESEENQYIMECIMRVLGVVDIGVDDVSIWTEGLRPLLSEVCTNPKYPIFNQYLFESVAILVKRACERVSSIESVFQTSLLPRFQIILSNDVTELLPYTFELLSLLVELNTPPIPLIYLQIFDSILLSADSWKSAPNVPALGRLFQAFLEIAPNEIGQEDRVSKVLGIFYTLIQSSSTLEQGFCVLNNVCICLDYDAIKGHMSVVWAAIFEKLQKSPSVKLFKSLLILISIFLVKHSSENLVDSMNSADPGMFMVILDQFWIPNLKLITQNIELKYTAVASTRLICESPVLLHPAASASWGKMLDSIVMLLSQSEQDRVEEEGDEPDITVSLIYSATFVRLHSVKTIDDPLTCLRDPRRFFVASLSRLCTLFPGRYLKVIRENVDPASQEALIKLCKRYHYNLSLT